MPFGFASPPVRPHGLGGATCMARASNLLANTAMTFAEVAQALGYADARSLRRAFKRWTG